MRGVRGGGLREPQGPGWGQGGCRAQACAAPAAWDPPWARCPLNAAPAPILPAFPPRPMQLLLITQYFGELSGMHVAMGRGGWLQQAVSMHIHAPAYCIRCQGGLGLLALRLSGSIGTAPLTIRPPKSPPRHRPVLSSACPRLRCRHPQGAGSALRVLQSAVSSLLPWLLSVRC